MFTSALNKIASEIAVISAIVYMKGDVSMETNIFNFNNKGSTFGTYTKNTI